MNKLVALSTLTALTTLTIATQVLAGDEGPDPTVPEPATWALFGAAAIAILVIKKFKK